jgi:prevent-host-death family protein
MRMAVIPQRELRNEISSVLRRVEQGETFTVTVSGRPVAELGPIRDHGARRRSLDEILASTPVDAAWSAELQLQRAAESTRP